jgi:hypothetical protein
MKPRKPPPAPAIAPEIADDFVAIDAPVVADDKSKGGRPRKVDPDEKIVQTTLRLPEDLHQALRIACLTRKVSLSELVAELVRQELKVS